jgi:hypothetical protein
MVETKVFSFVKSNDTVDNTETLETFDMYSGEWRSIGETVCISCGLHSTPGRDLAKALCQTLCHCRNAI